MDMAWPYNRTKTIRCCFPLVSLLVFFSPLVCRRGRLLYVYRKSMKSMWNRFGRFERKRFSLSFLSKMCVCVCMYVFFAMIVIVNGNFSGLCEIHVSHKPQWNMFFDANDALATEKRRMKSVWLSLSFMHSAWRMAIVQCVVSTHPHFLYFPMLLCILYNLKRYTPLTHQLHAKHCC